MRQAWHIFLKDSRQFRYAIELLLAWTTLFAFSGREWFHTSESAAIDSPFAHAIAMVPVLSTVLIPAAWWALIAAVVHAEALPGDRQFWVTRPYSRLSLFASKALFALVYMMLPLALAQVVLLVRSDMPISTWWSGLLWNQVLIAVVIVLPAFALAALTSTMVQFVFASGVTVGLSYLAQSDSWHGINWVRISLGLLLMTITAAFVVANQYRYRRTARSRLVSLSGVLVTLLVALLFPWPAAFAVQAAVRPMKAAPLTADLLPLERLPEDLQRVAPPRDPDHARLVELRFATTGIGAETPIACNGVEVVIERPGGDRWKASLWRNPTAYSAGTGEQGCYASFRVPSGFVDAALEQSVRVTGVVYVTQFDHASMRVAADGRPVVLGDVVCAAVPSFLMSRRRPDDVSRRVPGTDIECRRAFADDGVELDSRGSSGRSPNSYSPFPARLTIMPLLTSRVVTATATPTVAVRSAMGHARVAITPRSIRLQDYLLP